LYIDDLPLMRALMRGRRFAALVSVGLAGFAAPGRAVANRYSTGWQVPDPARREEQGVMKPDLECLSNGSTHAAPRA
jgi:hypothetical protein